MKRWLSMAVFALFAAGCNAPREYRLNAAEMKPLDGFQWDGTIRVVKIHRSGALFGHWETDRIEFGSRDGQALLLDTSGAGVRAYRQFEVVRGQVTSSAPDGRGTARAGR